ncbi:hypothetical protein DFH08DRAFT_821143 [Mycena albidolilacea]|uniref:Uncharacterized protein n=1 Tax=Mycena albidolilacea TaxID=1033008 RepID=A0AAD6ZBC4_9AGAR|nr:hypothetical protein DFH08DRAFT_821143 [Mycena albidolilacea]
MVVQRSFFPPLSIAPAACPVLANKRSNYCAAFAADLIDGLSSHMLTDFSRLHVTTNPELFLDNSNFRYSHIRRSASPSPSDAYLLRPKLWILPQFRSGARPLYAEALKTPVNTYSYIEQNSYYIEWFISAAVKRRLVAVHHFFNRRAQTAVSSFVFLLLEDVHRVLLDYGSTKIFVPVHRIKRSFPSNAFEEGDQHTESQQCADKNVLSARNDPVCIPPELGTSTTDYAFRRCSVRLNTQPPGPARWHSMPAYWLYFFHGAPEDHLLPRAIANCDSHNFPLGVSNGFWVG